MPALPPGRYELRAELAGFKTQIRRDVDLTVNETLSLAVVLEVGAVDLVTEIVVAEPTVNTSTSELSYLVGQDGDRAAAAEWAQLHRPRAAAAGRPRVSASRRRIGRRARPRDERQRSGSAVQRLPARRHAAERLHQRSRRQRRRHGARHGRGARVPGRGQRLQRRVRPQLRRPGQRADEVRQQRSSTAACSSTTATTRSTPGTTSTPAASPTSTATSSAAALGGPLQRNRTFFFLNYEALIERLGRTISTVVPDDNARLGILPTGAVGRQSGGRAVSRRVPARQRAAARAGAGGLRLSLRADPRRALRAGAHRPERRSTGASCSRATRSTTPTSTCRPTIRSFRASSCRATSSSPASTARCSRRRP